MTEDNRVLKKTDLIIPELTKLQFKMLPLPPFKDKNKKEIDFTKDIKPEEIDKKLTLKVGEFKVFYDELLDSFTKYDNSIDSIHTKVVDSLSSIIENIGNQTEELNSIIVQLQKDMPY